MAGTQVVAIYPGAQYRPLAATPPSRMSSHDIVCLHTMVGSLAGTDSYFKQGGYAGTESHFGVGWAGLVYQWVDTTYRADANLNGNHHIISIETADFGEGPFGTWNTGDGNAVPAWTGEQVEAVAQIVAWACTLYGIPAVLIPNTVPGVRGIGYHAQGVPGNGLVAGGEAWSLARGKVCPGWRRIAQIPQVIVRARQIMGGAPPGGEPDLDATQDKMLTRIHQILTSAETGADRFIWIEARLREIEERLGNVSRAVYGGNPPDGEPSQFTWLEGQTRQIGKESVTTVNASSAAALHGVEAELASLREDVAALSKPDPAPNPAPSARDLLLRAGFTGDAVDVALGVSMAESAGFSDAVGDVVLVDTKWGPSIGLFQIRSLRNPDAWGVADKVRRASELRDPAFNAAAAYVISEGGADWSKWTAFRTGAFEQYKGRDYQPITGHPRADQWNL